MTTVAQELDYVAQVTQRRLGDEKVFSSEHQFNGLKPWLQRPSDWNDFSPTNRVQLGAVGTDTQILIYQIPDGQDGVIEALSVEYFASVYNIGDLKFRVFNTGRPVRNFEAIQTNLGSQQIPWNVRIQVKSGDVITIVVSHIANALLTGKDVAATLRGYLYTSSAN